MNKYYCKKDLILTGNKWAYTKGNCYTVKSYNNDWGLYLNSNKGSFDCLFSFKRREEHLLYLYDYFKTLEEIRNDIIDTLLCQ